MTFWAWAIFLLTIGYSIWDGVRRTRGTKDLEGFFAAGRSIPWWAAGLSVMATQLSAITIIGGVGMGHENGLEWVQFYFALPFAMIVLCIWFVPMFRRHPILTAYEFLERRFGPVTRSLTSLMFLVSRCLAFAIVLYAPAVVFSVMTGLSITPTIWITGLLTTTYTVIGGIGGVVWTDVKQMLLIAFGVTVCLVFLLYDTCGQLGFGGVFEALGAAGKMNPVEITNSGWSLLPVAVGTDAPPSFWEDKYNLWTGLFGTLFLFLSYFGCDQSQVQSILTSKSVGASRRALLMSAFAKVPLQLVVLLLGALLYLHHSLGDEPLLFRPMDQEQAAQLVGTAKQDFELIAGQHAEAARQRAEGLRAIAAGTADTTQLAAYHDAVVAAAKARKSAQLLLERDAGDLDTNFIFPRYLFRELPKPLLGLMLGAIFAAAISSAAGALSSLTGASMIDFYRRWLAPATDQRTALRHSRIVMFCWGIAATAAADWLGGGPLLERVNEIGSWFYGSILGVFLLAIFVPRASGTAASAGLLCGFGLVLLEHATFKFAYLWDNLIGCVGCLLVGGVVTVLAPRRPAPETAASAPPVDEPPPPLGSWARTYSTVAVLAIAVMAALWFATVLWNR
ncbi:MAG: sodium:solute symporter [Planctomycetota bacterium]